MNALKKYNLADQEFIDKNELYSVLQDKQLFPEEYSKLLLGPDISLDKAFCILDKDGYGKARFQDFRRRSIDNLGDFIFACLEQVGIMPQVKSLAGSSAGTIVAAAVALGYNSQELEQIMSDDWDAILKEKLTIESKFV